MRWLATPLLLFTAIYTMAGQPPPAYQALRFEEDYAYLRDADRRTDTFDHLRYIPLRTGDSGWYLSLGGELRERVEVISHPDFGFSGGQDAYLLQRLVLIADFHLGDRVRFFVEGISGSVWGESLKAPPTQDNPADLQFAFADLKLREDLKLRLGRFGMNLGSSRLIATRSSPNIPYKFDGAELICDGKTWEAHAFLTRPGEERKNGIDLQDDDTTLWGLYGTRWNDTRQKNGVDLYYIGLKRENSTYAASTGTQTRHSIGTRIFGENGAWDWDGEALLQFGRFAGGDLLAWTGSIHAGYTWREAPWRPRIGMKLDAVSGDRDPYDDRLETFDPLFFRSPYFNEAGLLRPANIIDVHPTLTVSPLDRLQFSMGVDVFWRMSTRDAIYDPPGNIQVPVTDDRSHYFGTAVDVNMSWRLQRHALLSASYVYFFTDSYVRSAGGSDTGFFTTSLTLQF